MQFERAFALLIGLCLWNPAAGQATDPPATGDSGRPSPRVYALIAAIGGEFSIVHEVSTTGTHLAPYRRTATNVTSDTLNHLALNGLDAAIAKISPESKRIYLVLPALEVAGVEPSLREGAAIAKVVTALETVPERRGWDRIVVATPAYKTLATDGMASKLSGMGIFSEPMCQAGCAPQLSRDDTRGLDMEPPNGVVAVTSDDKAIKTRTYLAPYSYITVWVLDPKTLKVLDKQQGFDNQKLAEPAYKPTLDPDRAATQQYLNRRLSNLISSSIGGAVLRSSVNDKRGTVEVGDVKIVKPDDAPK